MASTKSQYILNLEEQINALVNKIAPVRCRIGVLRASRSDEEMKLLSDILSYSHSLQTGYRNAENPDERKYIYDLLVKLYCAAGMELPDVR